MSQTELGDRMKQLEGTAKTKLFPRLPIIIRLDGKAFHTFTRGMIRPYDRAFNECMWETTKFLCSEISGCRLGYTQSDEITLVLVDQNEEAQPWFDGQVQKMASVSASFATGAFLRALVTRFPDRWVRILETGKGTPAFDSRVWNVTPNEVPNVLIWRQQDASRNSVSSLAQAHFSHKQLHGISKSGMQDLLMVEKGINWNDCPVPQKRGVCAIKENYLAPVPIGWPGFREGLEPAVRTRWTIDENIPIFTTPEGREYISNLITRKENA